METVETVGVQMLDCPVCGQPWVVDTNDWGTGYTVVTNHQDRSLPDLQCEASTVYYDVAQRMAAIQKANGGREAFQMRAHP